MLALLITLAAIWTIYWIIRYLIDWSYATPGTHSKNVCPTCANAFGSANANSANSPSDNKVSQDNVAKQPVADEHDQSNVKPLFEAPDEKDDLKVIKGIGVVMEKTLNDLGITTFKQLAGFQQAEIKMVSDVLSEANSGFGDRIERDAWVDQAKQLA